MRVKRIFECKERTNVIQSAASNKVNKFRACKSVSLYVMYKILLNLLGGGGAYLVYTEGRIFDTGWTTKRVRKSPPLSSRHSWVQLKINSQTSTRVYFWSGCTRPSVMSVTEWGLCLLWRPRDSREWSWPATYTQVHSKWNFNTSSFQCSNNVVLIYMGHFTVIFHYVNSLVLYT